MARKNDDRRKDRKELTLSKETIRDLTPGKKPADGIRAGAKVMSYVEEECTGGSHNIWCKP